MPRAVGGLGPLAVGLFPGRFGLARVLAGLMLVPIATLVTLKRRDLLSGRRLIQCQGADRQGESCKSGMAAQPGPGDVLATPPRRIVVAGDWHGDQDWALHVIGHVPRLLGGENNLLILHLGDFGIWPDTTGKDYLTGLSGALRRVGAQLWFVDGNHEDFSQLTRMADDTDAGWTRDCAAEHLPPTRAVTAGIGTVANGSPAAVG